MFNFDLHTSISRLAVAFVPVVLGIILHEVAHGWVASLRGDQTARMLGRVTLNPLPHIDPMGLGMFVLTALSPMGFIFGWARPVPVNPRNFRSPRLDDILVSAAGALTNMALAVLFAILLRVSLSLVPPEVFTSSGTARFFLNMFMTGVVANFGLAWVNLLPIPPLDGSHILANLLPGPLAYQYQSLGRYGFLILIALLMFNILGAVVVPLIDISVRLVFSLVGLSEILGY